MEAANSPAPTAASTAQAEQTAKPTPGADAAEVCKQALAQLAKGDTTALNSSPPGGSGSLVGSAASEPAVTCLAVAADNLRMCDALPDQAKQGCVAHAEMVRQLKAVPKEAVKAEVFYRLCLSGSPKQEKAVCDKAREAVVSGKIASCAAFKQPSERDLCAGIATGDATKCSAFTDAAQRDYCVAFATGDVQRCPKDSEHCRTMIGTIAALSKADVDAVERLDPILAAAKKGKQACAPLLTALERDCRGEK